MKKRFLKKTGSDPRVMHGLSCVLSGNDIESKKIEKELISSFFLNFIENKSERDFVNNFMGFLGYILANKQKIV